MSRVARATLVLALLGAAGCARLGSPAGAPLAGAVPAVAVVENSGAARPLPRPVPDAAAGEALPVAAPAARPRPPPRGARTAAEFDTTTAAERAAARAPAAEPERRLGSTIASLGAPADPGFWLLTPLVAEPVRGRVVVPATGASLQVELRPSGGAPGSGSRLSLPAFRLLGLPLTALAELEVFAF